jgi:hypothetical protein
MKRAALSYGWTLLRTLPTHPRLFEKCLRGPLFVHVQTTDRCNGKCIMCPYPLTRSDGPGHEIESGLYTRILKELREAGTVKKIVPHAECEPLLNERLEERISEARKVLGNKVKIHIVTNGTLLSRERADGLAAAGMDVLTVSLDAFREPTYSGIRPGFDFEDVKMRVKSLLDGDRTYTLKVSFVRQRANHEEEKEFTGYWQSLGAEVEMLTLWNRAGSVENFDSLAPGRKPPGRASKLLGHFFPACLNPFTWLVVLLDGKVLLCCQDWERKAVIGDLSSQSLADVWNGKTMREYRAALWRRRVRGDAICGVCTVAAGLIRQLGPAIPLRDVPEPDAESDI